jgi:hypothetical protein
MHGHGSTKPLQRHYPEIPPAIGSKLILKDNIVGTALKECYDNSIVIHSSSTASLKAN